MFSKENRQLPGAQLKVMRVLWDSPASLTAKQIIIKYLKQATKGFLSQHYRDSMFCMVSTFADGRLTDEELQELRALMEKLEK